MLRCTDPSRHLVSSRTASDLVWFVQFDLAKADSVPVGSEDHLNRWIQEQLAAALERLRGLGGTDHALRIVSEHPELADTWHLPQVREAVHNGLGDPVAQVFHLGITAGIGERQNKERVDGLI